jgi:hypothetical protein
MINSLMTPCPPRMTHPITFQVCACNRFGETEFSAILRSTPTREAHAVDLALKWNVLAVCAVFLFVGAILLGAF